MSFDDVMVMKDMLMLSYCVNVRHAEVVRDNCSFIFVCCCVVLCCVCLMLPFYGKHVLFCKVWLV